MIILFIILALYLFSPSIFYNYSFIINFILITSFTSYNYKKNYSNVNMFAFIIFGLLLFSIKFFFFQSFEDFKWYLRFVIFILTYYMFIILDIQNVSYNIIYKLLFAYIIVNFGISFLEILRMHDSSILLFVKKYYWSEVHAEVRYRAKGLNFGPGQFARHIFLMNFVLGFLILIKKHNKFILLLFLLTIIMAVFTSSRTGLFTISLLSFIVIWYSKNKWMIFTSAIALPFTNIFNEFYFVRTTRFLDKGVSNDSSAVSRYSKWAEFFNTAMEKPAFIISGWSETVFSEISHSTDNEFVSVFLFFGIIGLIAFILFELSIIKRFFKITKEVKFNVFFAAFFMCILINQMFAQFYTDYFSLFIILIIFNEYKQYNGNSSLIQNGQIN